jgi:O-antigen ligase
MGSPIIAATYLELLLAPALGLLVTKPAPWLRNLALAAFGLGAIALVFTYSRAAWGGFVLSVGFFSWFAWQRGWLPKVAPTLIASVILIVFAVFFTPITARIFGPDMGSAESRLPLMDLAFRMIQDHPLFGVGANNFGLAVYNYLTPEFSGDFLWAVHNKYLLVFSETGIGGFLAYIFFLLVTVKRGWQVWRKAEPALALIALALTGAMLGQMMHMFVDVFHGRPQVQLLWLVAALISSMHLQLGQKNAS